MAVKALLVLVTIALFGACSAADVCSFAPESGDCDSPVSKRFFFNTTTNQCEVFFYTGCGGNGNNFEEKHLCEFACLYPPVDEIGREFDNSEDDDVDKAPVEETAPREDFSERKRTPSKLFGSLFQESLLKDFGAINGKIKSHFDSMFDDVFDKFKPEDKREEKLERYDDIGEEDKILVKDDEVSENSFDGDENKYENDLFKNPFDIFYPRALKPKLSIFSKPFGGSFFNTRPKLPKVFRKLEAFKSNPLGKIWSKTIQEFESKVDKSFKELNNVLNGKNTSLSTDDALQCEVCKAFVQIVEYELKVLQMSLKAIENVAKFICKFFPWAQKQCNVAFKFIDEIIKDIDQGLSPEDVCINVNLCPNTTLPDGFTSYTEVTFSREQCNPLCNLMKASHVDKAEKMLQIWNDTSEKLHEFCNENKILQKCDIFFKILHKSRTHLSRLIAQQEEENCKCFERQPLFETKESDPCLRCNQLQQGMVNDAALINKTVEELEIRVKELCELFSSKSCFKVNAALRASLAYNTVHMPGICKVTGYCSDKNKNKTNIADKMLEGSLKTFRNIFSHTKALKIPGLTIDFKKFTPDCKFCKKCMGDLKETFKKVDGLNETVSSVIPAVKEGFSMYCQTKTTDGQYTTVCKKITDGIESVHKFITKRSEDDGEELCKTLDVC